MANQSSEHATSGVHARRVLASLALSASLCSGCEATSYDSSTDSLARITADKIRQRTQRTAGNVARSVPDMRPFTQGEAWTALSGAVAGFLGVFDSVPLFPSATGAPGSPPAPSCLPEERGPDGQCTFNPRAVLLELASFLETWLFSDEHLESSDRSSATFLLRGASMCAAMQACDAAGEPCPEPSTSCIESIDAAQVRVRARLVGAEGLDVALLVGPHRAQPISLELRRTAVAIEIDLESAKLALDHLQAVAGNGEAELADAQGRVRLEFVSGGPDDIWFVSSIREALRFRLNVPQGPIDLSIGARSPALALRAHGARQTLSVALDNGPIDLSVPYAFLTDGRGSGNLALHLSGQTWRMDATVNQRSLALREVSWREPSTLAKDGVPIFSLDINPNSGRKLDLSLTPAEGPSGILFRVQPEFHVTAHCNLQVIAPEFPDIPAVFQNTKYEIALRGAGEASVLPITDSASASHGSLKVVTGELSLHATGNDALVTRAGECIKIVEKAPQQLAFELDPCR